MKKWIACIIMFSAAAGWSADRMTGKMFETRSEVISQNGMVATSHPLASMIGIDVLKNGGNAVDAAIAMNAALGLMEPTGNGIGGDLFAIVWDASEQKLYGLNASGTAPEKLTLDILKKKGLEKMPEYGPLPWTVPGCVDGWYALNGKFGSKPMKELLQPAISYAEKGFPLTELIAWYWKRSVSRFEEYENFQNTYAPGGKCPEKGDVFRNPDLAKTLKIIAQKGRDAFYKGDIADKIVAYSDKVGGYFTKEDFSEFSSEWVEPLSVNYKGFDVWELPPNGQGIAALQMLNMLEKVDVKAMGHNTAEYLHTLVEIKKIVYEDRARLYCDQRFHSVPIVTLLSDEYAERRLTLLNPQSALRRIPLDDAVLEKGDTIYLTAADKEGNMVSLIQSNYYGFGSAMVPDGLGFCIQDRGALFSLEEGHPNVFEPGKRPFHTIIPAFVTKDGKPLFSFGVMGGSMQPQGHVQVLMNILEFGMNIQEAGDAPRFRHGGSSQPEGGVMTDGGTLYLESGICDETIRELVKKGHRISKTVGGFGGYQGIWKNHDNNTYLGGSESRKDGCALGY